MCSDVESEKTVILRRTYAHRIIQAHEDVHMHTEAHKHTQKTKALEDAPIHTEAHMNTKINTCTDLSRNCVENSKNVSPTILNLHLYTRKLQVTVTVFVCSEHRQRNMAQHNY